MKSMLIGCLALGWLGPAIGKESALKVMAGERFVLDLKYHSTQNFLKKNVYAAFHLNQCWVLSDLEKKLQLLTPQLKAEKLKLVFWDCYRPLEVQKAMWKLVPDPRYVADPLKGSHHNRGAAIDVALQDEQGRLLAFPTPFDDFSPQASSRFPCSSNEREKCENRDKLIALMASVGLEVFPTEWWHFQLPHPEKYPVIKTVESAK